MHRLLMEGMLPCFGCNPHTFGSRRGSCRLFCISRVTFALPRSGLPDAAGLLSNVLTASAWQQATARRRHYWPIKATWADRN